MGNLFCCGRGKTTIPDAKSLPAMIGQRVQDQVKDIESRVVESMKNQKMDCPIGYYYKDDIVINTVMDNMRSKGFLDVQYVGPNEIYSTPSIRWSYGPPVYQYTEPTLDRDAKFLLRVFSP